MSKAIVPCCLEGVAKGHPFQKISQDMIHQWKGPSFIKVSVSYKNDFIKIVFLETFRKFPKHRVIIDFRD